MTIQFYLARRVHLASRQFILFHKRLLSKYHDTQSCILSCKELKSIKDKPLWYQNYRILDATWDLEKRDYSIDHFSNRIPASKFFDLEECRDKSSPYLMMLPSPEQFEDYVSELGISNNHHVIIYDNHVKYAMFSAPRLWWMFRMFGHDNVSVLNGGLSMWIQEGHDTVSGDYTVDEDLPKPSQKFKASTAYGLVKDYEFVKANSEKENPVTLLEARPRDTESIPGAMCSPFYHLLDIYNRSIRSPKEIEEYFTSINIDLDKELVTTCGRGVSAAIVSFCVKYATGNDVPVYDGSWSEWAGRRSSQS